MREPLIVSLIFIATYLTSCGVPGVRSSISEEPSKAEQVKASGSAFHSLTGWRDAMPFYISEEVPDHLIDPIENAARTWNDSMGFELLKFQGMTSVSRGDELYSSLDDDINVVFYEENWSSTTGKPRTTLATAIWENDIDGSDAIVKGDIILNAQSYYFQDSMDEPMDHVNEDLIVDAESVVLHEIGHLLGLDHVRQSADRESVMHAKTYIGPNIINRRPSEGDIQNIRRIYSE